MSFKTIKEKTQVHLLHEHENQPFSAENATPFATTLLRIIGEDQTCVLEHAVNTFLRQARVEKDGTVICFRTSDENQVFDWEVPLTVARENPYNDDASSTLVDAIRVIAQGMIPVTEMCL